MTGQEKKKEVENKTEKEAKKDGDKDDGKTAALTESDIALFKRYGKGPYTESLKKTEDDIKDINQKISALCGIKESDTGLALPA